MTTCKKCENPWKLMWTSEPLAGNEIRHSFLYRCDECGSFYEIIPEERKTPEKLTEAEIRERFPDFSE